MLYYWLLPIGISFGACVGYGLAAMLIVGKRGDDWGEEDHNKEHPDKPTIIELTSWHHHADKRNVG